ncbi:MAG: phosphoribosylglycinamide formyltransferase [Caulobacterales bacterium 32-69-10]|nr:MAG: phosphoribosylglycinamide formyltransferase [Caulobacterales bacterium 32-69-10]
MSGRVRVGVLISGRGSNMEALIAAARAPDYPAEIAVVLSNRIDAPGLRSAEQAGVAAFAIDQRPFGKDREAHERAIDAELREAGVELVCLAGYMRILSPWFVKAWAGRLLNIHPSLLPHFPGVDTHQRALDAGHTTHGCTVHWVIEALDAGPIVGQAQVPVYADDTEAALAARVLTEEHKLYARCVAEAARRIQAERTA